jgi:hypothetical protein
MAKEGTRSKEKWAQKTSRKKKMPISSLCEMMELEWRRTLGKKAKGKDQSS